MPSATMNSWQALTGSGQSSNPEARDGGKFEDYSEFLICQRGTKRERLSVCEQRNAALVRATLGEKEEVSV